MSRQRQQPMIILVWLVLLYGAACTIAWFAADSMIFLPQYASRAEPDGSFKIVSKAGLQLSAVHLPNPAAKLTLWYFHGNAESLTDILPRLRELHDFGFAVFAVEYPGYGTSDGTATEPQVYASIDAGLEVLRTKLGVAPTKILAYGRSLGSGPAVELASKQPVAGLILESGFMSAYRVMTRWPILVGDRFANLRKMPRVTCPVLVIHGRDDRTIPWHHGEALYRAAPNPKKMNYWIEFGGHNDLPQWMGGHYRDKVSEFVRSL